ncbi:MAG: single-stranded-DNA-specific exonuclease RecJ [Chloroflexi bacterium]|nr:single-stranded-DNA-specific exonuclease RecJ [Chloroflexota bacterium]
MSKLKSSAAKRQWEEPRAIDVPAALRDAVGGHALISEHLRRKGIRTPAAARTFLSPAHYEPASASELPDIERAVDRLQRAIRARERILIWGDFDVDGQTSTALLFSALKRKGAQVSYHVPNRFSEGHGIHLPTLVKKLEGGVNLVLTCDTGVAAHEAVDCARGRGVDTVITDHHALPAELPAAWAVVNPRRLPAGHPLSELPGVGVAYKLIEALYQGDDSDFLLDLVALGIVADVMVQVDDTRYLLQRGLDILRRNKRLGVRALLERAQIAAADLNEGHIGFELAPRLNALGRLGDANPAVELLTTADWQRARQLANNLEGLNAKRKFLSNQVYQSAIAQIDGDPSLLDYAALVLSHSDWHSGVIGIVASRLVEEFARPVVLLATPEATARGSARSLAGVDITAAFGEVAPLLSRYGGHSMAAGLSLPAEKVFEFRRALSGVARAMMGEGPAAPSLHIDGYLELGEISLELTQDIERLAPFGNGNPPLTLATRDLRLVKQSGLGRRGEHLELQVEDGAGTKQRVIWWRGAGQELPAGRFDLAYTLRSNDYKGVREPLVEWADYRLISSAALEVQAEAVAVELIDHRRSLAPVEQLEVELARFPDALIWSEVDKMAGAIDRLGLRSQETLIVWTVPPSAEIWSAALATVNPARLILFGNRPEDDSRASFLGRLAALVKYALNHKDGAAQIEALATAMGQRERGVQVGLQVLRALGKLAYRVGRTGEYQLTERDDPPSDDLKTLQKRLDMILRETRAYRDYWQKMRVKG